MTGSAGRATSDMLIVVFTDIDPYGRPSFVLPSALQGELSTPMLIEDRWASVDFASTHAALSLNAKAHRRLACIGVGAGARAALLHGLDLKADVIVAWCPTGGVVGGTYNVTAIEKAFQDAVADQKLSVHLTSASDTAATDMALARKLRPAAAGIRLERLEGVPYLAMEQALVQAGLATATIGAAIAGEPLPKLHDLPDRWLSALAYEIDVDPVLHPAANGDGLEITGKFRNTSAGPFDLNTFERDLICIGVKYLSSGDDPQRPRGERFALGPGKLARGSALPFTLAIPEDTLVRGFDARIALVCEGRYWFDDHGFSVATMGVPALRA